MSTEEKQPKENSPQMKVKFSIGAKLILIIGIIVLVSLGSITLLVSWLVREDLKISAEDNNFEVNRRSATEAKNTLSGLYSNSLILIRAVSVMEKGPAVQQTLELFFEYNQNAAFLLYAVQGKPDELFINKRFFIARDIDQSLADKFADNYRSVLRRVVSGETLLLNVTPWFKSPMLAYFVPSQNGALAVLFTPEDLNNSFGFGVNQSVLINDSGDILVHSDSELVKIAANIADRDFTKLVLGHRQRSAQVLYTDEDGKRFFGAFSKLDIAGAVVITSIEYDKVFEGINATTRRNIYLTFTVLSISILLIWFFSKSISVPLRGLAGTAHAIQEGRFKHDFRKAGNDEIGVLTRSFERMSAALNVFGKFTNRDIAVRAMRGELKPGGMPKHATILFTDMRSFTEKSEKCTIAFGSEASDKIVHWLNDYFSRMVECVEKTGGVVDKFIGDGLMAHWGTAFTAGSPQKDAVNCVMATLMMRKALFEMNKTRSPNDPANPIIQIGCGVNTGIVTAGQIGSDLKIEYTVIGDPVNLASRTESQTKPLAVDILITEDTWNLVKNYFITHEMPAVTVKGKEKPVKLYTVINYAGASKGPQTLADVRKLFAAPAPASAPSSNPAYTQSSTRVSARTDIDTEGAFISTGKKG